MPHRRLERHFYIVRAILAETIHREQHSIRVKEFRPRHTRPMRPMAWSHGMAQPAAVSLVAAAPPNKSGNARVRNSATGPIKFAACIAESGATSGVPTEKSSAILHETEPVLNDDGQGIPERLQRNWTRLGVLGWA
jgi:hypothetical protein